MHAHRIGRHKSRAAQSRIIAQPRHIVARGELWARPIRIGLTSTADEERLWSALVFGTSLYNDLSEREMMTLAVRGGAVSPVSISMYS